jgi:ABC-type multidrug transport system fused ATPase/permease subunit
MLKKIMLSWWGVSILTIVYLYLIELFIEHIISREVASEIQIVLTFGVLVYTYYMLKLIYNFIYNSLKQEKND